MTPFDLILVCVLVLAAAHFVSIAVLIGRRFAGGEAKPAKRPPITILRPACGIENYIEDTLASAFAIDYPDFEIVFCVASESDPIVPVIQRLIDAHPKVAARLLIGDDPISINPKLNNLVKGWKAAKHDWIVMADSNVLMPPDYLDALLARWDQDTGLVCAPPIGSRPDSTGAELECAFLNTYQARWQLTADVFGNGFAQGKTMFWRRDILDDAGGIAALSSAVAEDIASTRVVRARGLKIHLVERPFQQPLGLRTFAQVWQRQLRWAQLRRNDLTRVFACEPFSFPMLAFLLALVCVAGSALSLPSLLLLIVAWYGAEVLLAAAMGWYLSAMSPLLFLLRDLLMPLIWVTAVFNGNYEWRGNRVGTKDSTIERVSEAR